MKIIKIAEPGKIMSQPSGKKPSGKLDTQIFLEKEDPTHVAKKKRKKCTSCTIQKKNKEKE